MDAMFFFLGIIVGMFIPFALALIFEKIE